MHRKPDTVSTSTTNHFATCVAKPVSKSFSVQLTSNRVSVHNPKNVEASKICWYLLNVYTGVFDISYTDHQSYKISQGLIINTFDPIEMLTIHSYTNNIVERKEERSIRGLQLVGVREQYLHMVEDYLNALNIILLINSKMQHLDRQVAPVVADWPSQLFIKKLLYLRKLFNTNFVIPQQIESFLPILGPLHLSLNKCRENKPTKKSAPKNSTNKTSTKKNSTKASAKAPAKKTYTKGNKSKKKPPEIYQLATLKKNDDNSMVYVCGHGYYIACYNKKCKYCEEYYKREIFENANSFLKQIEKGENKLTRKDLDDEENDIEEGADEVSKEIEEAQDTSSKLAAEIYNIEHW
ncbi:hypothetical protein C2G38_2159173 [Gigaspora rosea]|uniref:Uncharacterized protein n=1 Tax=Gigaspora rosea TaxID=44941 RepID=A0A397W6R1_9GLOM|nr:hypothetical protein C2G38_2159173 [Gigaspora rosea]